MTDSIRTANARRVITEKCLIAADVDRTILSQVEDREEEAKLFHEDLASQLVKAARMGANIAFLTANSMGQLCSRVLRNLVHQLAHNHDLPLISQFHFFCNSAGAYFHFPKDDIDGIHSEAEFCEAAILRWHDDEEYVNPRFVHGGYLSRTLINDEDVDSITRILNAAADQYVLDFQSKAAEYHQVYELSDVTSNGQVQRPAAEVRKAHFNSGSVQLTATVQVTLKPVLSFKHARIGKQLQLFGNDLRTEVIRSIQRQLDHAGLDRYAARPGGRGSIDVTLERLDKAYALEFLIDYLRVEGNPRKGQRFGSNTIFFGDEVIIGGGNDFPVTRIPGLLVFAVNRNRELVPFSSAILVPSAITEGPAATAKILTDFNQCAEDLIDTFRNDKPTTMTAIDALKHKLFTSRIEKKIGDLVRKESVPIDDWAALHTFVTLLSRDDPAARYWLSLLVNELDSIMMQPHATSKPAAIMASGASHDS